VGINNFNSVADHLDRDWPCSQYHSRIFNAVMTGL